MPATTHSATPASRSDSATPTRETIRSGLVIVNYGKTLMVEAGDTELIRCVARRNLERIVCGDRVVWQRTGEREGVIEAIEPRHTLLNRSDDGRGARPLAANIDRIIVVAATRPTLDAFLIDKYLVAAELAGITPVLVINKSDLPDAAAGGATAPCIEEYAGIGYTTLLTSARNSTGIEPLTKLLTGRTGILVGQSGVGKSSLIKRLLPELEITIGRLSDASGQGRHTTTTTTLYHLPHGGNLIDSPGVRDFRLGEVTQQELASGFREFQAWTGRCKFHNCRHLGEPGCALAAAASEQRISARRMESYRQLAAQS